MAEILKRERQVQHVPMSSLLTSAGAEELKSKAALVNDEEVIFKLLEALLRPEFTFGVIIDGFPRSKVQVECLKLLHDAMLRLWKEYLVCSVHCHDDVVID